MIESRLLNHFRAIGDLEVCSSKLSAKGLENQAQATRRIRDRLLEDAVDSGFDRAFERKFPELASLGHTQTKPKRITTSHRRFCLWVAGAVVETPSGPINVMRVVSQDYELAA